MSLPRARRWLFIFILEWREKYPPPAPCLLRPFVAICHHHFNVQNFPRTTFRRKPRKTQNFKQQLSLGPSGILWQRLSKDWISLLKMLKYGYFVARGRKWPDRRGWHFPQSISHCGPVQDSQSAPCSIIYLKYFPIQTSKFLTLETLGV